MSRRIAKCKPTYNELSGAFLRARTKRQRENILRQMLDTPEGQQMEDELNNEYYKQKLLEMPPAGGVQ
jgi:hypothetical protein